MWLNGLTQWEHRKIGNKHKKILKLRLVAEEQLHVLSLLGLRFRPDIPSDIWMRAMTFLSPAKALRNFGFRSSSWHALAIPG